MCDKYSYTKKEAQTIINQNKKRKQRRMKNRKEIRYYYCEHCNFFHLTKTM